MRALILALAIAACSAEAPTPANVETPSAATAITLESMPSWENARAAGVDFRGVGQEPGWMLDIHQSDRIVFLWDYGEQSAVFPLPAPTAPQEGATRYEAEARGHVLTITIRRAPCQDAMSGEPFPATVEIVIDQRELDGCGRTV